MSGIFHIAAANGRGAAEQRPPANAECSILHYPVAAGTAECSETALSSPNGNISPDPNKKKGDCMDFNVLRYLLVIQEKGSLVLSLIHI